MTEILLLLLALALTPACALFVAAEFSLTTVERGELERAVEAGERGADSALETVRKMTFQLSGAQLGITVTSLVIGMLAEPSLAALLRGPLGAVGLEAAASSVATVLGVVVSTVVLMVIGELVPKNWAISRPLAVAKAVAAPQRGFTAAFGPFIRHLNSTANRFVRRFGLEPAEELASARTPEELVAPAQHSAREGALEKDSAELFVRTLHLGELTAENVMTPRVAVVALEAHATAADAANLTFATGLSRFPVHRDSLDEVVGTIHIRDVLALAPEQRSTTPVLSLAAAPSLPADRLLERMRAERTMAVVIDEYGVEDSSEAGLLSPADGERLRDALELGTRPVGEILVPARRMHTVGHTVTPAGLERVAAAATFSRFPVKGPSGAVLGYLHIKDTLGLADRGKPFPRTALHPITRVRIDTPLDDTLTALRTDGSHLAAVTGETGAILGYVTMEDVLGELVGPAATV
ncbi:CNNM domain-containing protein [Streptomyces sp. NPDC003023]|uniref:CNNM domain-containing protein n=1 Tax=Streptomyces sp. NPDC003023 TaxID=3364675 RepID=UPI0036B1722C